LYEKHTKKRLNEIRLKISELHSAKARLSGKAMTGRGGAPVVLVIFGKIGFLTFQAV
jgi:hypothetical protein